MKYVGEGTNAAKSSGYFPACSAAVMFENPGKGQYALEQEAVHCSSAPAMESKKYQGCSEDFE